VGLNWRANLPEPGLLDSETSGFRWQFCPGRIGCELACPRQQRRPV